MTERVVWHGDELHILTTSRATGEVMHAWHDQAVDVLAAAFAATWGSFTLLFDASEGYAHSGDNPWTLMLEPPVTRRDGCSGWGGDSAEGALSAAARDLLLSAAGEAQQVCPKCGTAGCLEDKASGW